MVLNVKLENGAIKPTRAYAYDAGLDLYSMEDKFVWEKDSEIFDTGVHVEIPKGYVGFLKSKSGLNVNHGIVSEGVIDSGYIGTVKAKLHNLSHKPYAVHKGDKISQLVILPIELVEVNVVDEISGQGSKRGDGGFGSSGR